MLLISMLLFVLEYVVNEHALACLFLSTIIKSAYWYLF